MAGKAATRERRPRGSIDPEMVLDGAFEVARRDGIDNLSMPELAAHLGIGVTSIYWYFRNKEDLLRQMTARASTEMRNRSLKPDGWEPSRWREFLELHTHAARAAHQSDDLLTDLTLMRTSSFSRRTTTEIYEEVELILAYLVSAGFKPRTAWFAYSTLSTYVRGYLFVERLRQQNHTPPEGRHQLKLLDPVTMPIMTALVDTELVAIDMTGDDAFAFAIGMQLDEMERLLESDLASV